MKNNIGTLNKDRERKRCERVLKPWVFGSLALFLCMDVSARDCTRTEGGIAICVDSGGDISNDLGITWNGVGGKGEVYQPLHSSNPIQNLEFKFEGDEEKSKWSGSNLTAKIKESSTTLTINGDGRGMQMNDGNGTLSFILKDGGGKQVKLNLGSKTGTENHALKGNLIINNENQNNLFSFSTVWGVLTSLSNSLSLSQTENKIFSGFFGGSGIGGDVTLGAFGKVELKFGDRAMIEGKITLEAGSATIESIGSSTFILGGIYSSKGLGGITFNDKNVEISGQLSDNGEPNGNSAIVSSGGNITLQFDKENQNITVTDLISTINNTSQIAIKTLKSGATLTLNGGVESNTGTNGVNINLEGSSSTLVLGKKIDKSQKDNLQNFNFQGSGNTTTTIQGTGSKIEGQVSFSGSGANSINFQENGEILGDVIVSVSNTPTTTSLQKHTKGNYISFKKGGGIEGSIYSWGGKNTITFGNQGLNEVPSKISGKVSAEGFEKQTKAENTITLKSGNAQIGGLEVIGTGSATNTVDVEGGELTISGTGGDFGNALYASNSQGSNTVDVKNGTLTITGDISTTSGINQITTQNGASTKIGENSPIKLLAECGKNILSLNNGDSNTLKLKSLQANGNGENILGKTLVQSSDSSNQTQITSNTLKTDNAFSGTLNISGGVSTTGDGKNTILFSAGPSQNSSIISNIDDSDNLPLKDAISGNNQIFLDLSKSTLSSAEDAIQAYLKSPQTQTLKTLGEKSAIFGNISSRGGNNHILIEGKKEGAEVGGIDERSPTQSALFGNILTDDGSNNLLLGNSIITPSAIISKNGTTSDIGGSLSGNFITSNGNANIITVVNSSSSEDIFIYNLQAKGGNTNLLFDGSMNVEIQAQTHSGASAKLAFVLYSDISSYTLEDGNLDTLKNGGRDQAKGFQIELMGSQTPPQAKIRSVHKTDNSHNLILGGTTAGIITTFDPQEPQASQPPKSQSIIIGNGTTFIGSIQTKSTKVEMENDSKIFFHDFDSSDPQDKFSIPTLKVNAKPSTSSSTPSALISVASSKQSGEKFKLLVIGSSDDSGKSVPKIETGLQGESGATFMVRINPQANQETSTLGGENVGNEYEKRGHTYSDRIIIANIGNNTQAQSGIYYLIPYLDNHSQMQTIKYDSSKDSGSNQGGAKQAGNIAVLTVVNTQDNKAGIDLQLQDMLKGFDQIGGGLMALKTNINGTYDESGGFTTYFLDSLTTKGATNERKEASASLLGSNYDLYIANFNSLNKRMGELRENNHSQGVWARIFAGSQTNHFGLGTKTNYVTIQGGYDYAFGSEGANNYLGVALSYSTSDSKVQSSLTQKLNNEAIGFDNVKSSAVEVALYNSYVQDEGWYNDSIIKFGYITSTFNIYNQDQHYSTHNLALTLSDEFGYRFKLGENKEWFIDPQLEVAFGYFNQNELRQTLEDSWLHGIADALFTLRTRVGSSFGYDFKNFTENKPFQASVYLGVFYEYDFVSGGDITLTTNLGGESTNSSIIGSDKRVVMNVGTNMTIKDNTRIYFDFEKSFAGKITTDYQVNVGVRYSFGESNGYTPMIEKAEFKAPLKVEGESEEEAEEETNKESEGEEENKESEELN